MDRKVRLFLEIVSIWDNLKLPRGCRDGKRRSN